VRADDTTITGVDSLAGKKLCSVKGSTSATNVQKKVPGVNLQEYNTYTLCVDALKAGNVDALTTDDTILAGYAAQDANKGKLKVVGKTFSTENYGVGLKKGDVEFCKKVTDATSRSTSPAVSGRRRSTRTSARPATSPAPATRPPRRRAPDPAPREVCRPPTRADGIPAITAEGRPHG